MTSSEFQKFQECVMSDDASRSTWASWIWNLYEQWRAERNGAYRIVFSPALKNVRLKR